jgi:lipopolysaccharide export system permease protein
MRIINRYLFSAIAGSTGMVMLVLLSLGVFIEFISQLDDMGQGNYDLWMVIQYVALKMPRLAVGLLPVTVLLGSLLGLGTLASSSELIVMRAAGVSAWQLGRSVAMTGIGLALVGGLVGEFMGPQMDLYARQMRAVAKNGNADLAGSSAWLRDGDVVFNIRPSIDGIDDGGVFMFRFGSNGFLSGIGRGDSVESDEDGEWTVSNFQESMFVADGVDIGTDVGMDRIDKLTDLLAISAVKEGSLTGKELWAYVQHLKSNGLDADRYEIAFWSRVATVIGIAVMCVLALPFVFGSLRTTGAGARMIIGVMIGVGYFLMNRTMADSAAVFDLSPILVAWFPTMLLISITAVGLSRLR